MGRGRVREGGGGGRVFSPNKSNETHLVFGGPVLSPAAPRDLPHVAVVRLGLAAEARDLLAARKHAPHPVRVEPTPRHLILQPNLRSLCDRLPLQTLLSLHTSDREVTVWVGHPRDPRARHLAAALPAVGNLLARHSGPDPTPLERDDATAGHRPVGLGRTRGSGINCRGHE